MRLQVGQLEFFARAQASHRDMLSNNLAWGAVPDGFDKIVDAAGNRLVVRHDQSEYIDFSLCRGDRHPATEDSRYRGRGALESKTLANGETVLIRRYRHGGFFRRLTREHFFNWPPRPFRELAVTEELRRRGLRTLEVYGACVSRPRGPFYHGWLMTKQLSDAEDLWSVLQSGWMQRVGFDKALRAVAESIRAMHRQGVYHADLNLKNILLREEAGGVASYIIDYDKAKLFLGALPEALADRNLRRLWRSTRKLDPDAKVFPAAARQSLLSLYHGAKIGQV